ncbi:hypothetical protein Tco_1043114 [Tanacetum coccineum]|uniref:Uncharacterized protein n=1 Tax=Tanacetum coccineum TaxID=301880 RepID=A0ABQ5GLQ9_9ASTR
MKRKFKKHASPSKKITLVIVEEEEPELAKQFKKAPAKAERSKGIELLYDVSLLEEAQLKKDLKRSKRETNIDQAGGSSEGVDFESKVPDEPKGKSIDTSKGTCLKPRVSNVSKGDSSKSEYESWGDSGDEANVQDDEDIQDSDDEPQHTNDERTDSENQEINDDEQETEYEFVHTPLNYVPTHDITVEEYERINEELYGDVNVSLTDAEPADKEKDDEEMIVAGHVNINKEGAGNQVKDDAQTLKLSLYVINQSETVTTTPAPTIYSLISSLYHALQQIATIPTPTTTKATTSTTIVPDSETLAALQLRVTDIEKDVKELKDVDNSTKVISTIKYEVLNAIKEYIGSNLDDALHKMEHARKKQIPKETITLFDTTALEEFNQKTTLFETMTKSKSFNKSLKQRALYHVLMESILKDEDAMDEGVADKLKKRKSYDTDKDKGPSAGSDQGGKSTQAAETVFEVRDTQGQQNLREDTSNIDELPVVNVDPKVGSRN